MNKEEFIAKDLFDASMHLLKNPGKLLRPALVFIGAEIVEDKQHEFTDLAISIELLHVSSLIHDDIIDKSPVRRGVEAVQKKFGENIAMLAGDALIAKAIMLASPYGGKVINKISQAAMAMCAGEALDAKFEGKPVTLEQYIKIVRLKSASLISTSLGIAGSYIDSRYTDLLESIGLNAGIAFQIRDDVLDFLEGESEEAKTAAFTAFDRSRKINTKDEVKKAVKLNNEYIDSALKEANSLPNNSGKEPLLKAIETIRLSNNLL
ncbi:MAG: polyprenyl synthetase family protein [Candidatus Micrarchaeia archaeon]